MKQLNSNSEAKNHRVPALFLVAAFILAVTAGIIFARYVLQENHSGVAEAESFYFTSDLLKEESELKIYHIDPEAAEFDITFFNYADTKRVTKDTISASVAVTGGTCSPESFQITGGTNTSQKVTVTPSPNASSLTVTVTTSAPYKKTLSASFQREAGNEYKVEDAAGGRAAVLTITYVDEPPAGGITLIVPEDVVPDAANTLITKEMDGKYKITPTEPGQYSLVLLKKNINSNLSQKETDMGSANEITINGLP